MPNKRTRLVSGRRDKYASHRHCLYETDEVVDRCSSRIEDGNQGGAFNGSCMNSRVIHFDRQLKISFAPVIFRSSSHPFHAVTP